MMFGSHLSIAGGLHNAIVDANRLGFTTLQCFTKNQMQWSARPLLPDQIATFRETAARLNFPTIVAHDSYLINLAAPDDTQRTRAMNAFAAELQRCDQLGISCLVTHPGAHVGQGEEAGLARIIAAYRQILAAQPDGRVIICVETTAGQGSCLGHRFEQIAAILEGVANPSRMGVCMDTCHILAAGYDITTADGTRRVLDEFDRIVGLQHLKVMHLNDSKKPLGSRVDRHDHIGRGHVGLPAFEVICQDARFAAIPKIIETKKEAAPDGRDWDEVNLEILQKLAQNQRVSLEFRKKGPGKPPRNTKKLTISHKSSKMSRRKAL